MSEEELLELANTLIKLSDYCNTITSGNSSHRIAHLKYGLINAAERIKSKIKK